MNDSERRLEIDEPPAAAATKIRILVLDSYPIFRRGLLEVIRAEPDMELCAETDNTRDALRLLQQQRPDVMVVDVCLPGESGLTFLESASSLCRTVAFSMYDEGAYADRALRAGAAAYVAKYRPAEHLLSVIRDVHRRRADSAPARSCAKCGARADSNSPLATLSNREIEIFRIMGQGLPVRAIANRLHLSPKTVESHRENIKKKLGIKTSSELLIRAMLWTLPDARFRDPGGHAEAAEPAAAEADHGHDWPAHAGGERAAG